EVVQHLRRAVLLREAAGRTDGQLLEDYLSRRDEAALAALVHRHGPMVWGVCRRVLGDHHDAEDAFQATFLVLVRRAAAIASRELVANWLSGGADRGGWRAGWAVARGRGGEKQVDPLPDPAVVDPPCWREVQPMLDDEMSQLPPRYRAVLLLCEVQGRSR